MRDAESIGLKGPATTCQSACPSAARDSMAQGLGADVMRPIRSRVALAPLDDLSHDMGVGHMGAGHADHVELARGNRMTRRRDVLDLGRMEGGKLRRGPDLPGEVEMRRALHALHGDHVGQGGIGLDMATDAKQRFLATFEDVIMKPRNMAYKIRRCTGFNPSRTSGNARDVMTLNA